MNVTSRQYIKRPVKELNLFDDLTSRSDAFHHRMAIISTRIYLVLLTLAVLILIIYVEPDGQTQVFTVQNPSLTIYEILKKKDVNTLSCPCSQVTIPYTTFVSMSTLFHPICSSWFVSNDWINLLFDPDISYFFQLDFRSSATGQFQMLSSLCSFVKQSVRDSIDDFLFNTFFSPQLVTQQLMDAQVQSETLFLRTSTVNFVRQVLSLIRSTTQNNQLQSTFQTSKSLSIIVRSDRTAVINAVSSIFFDDNATLCSCGITSSCSSSSGIFNM
ncbi:unnamed protein product [Rotaria sp. Silwood2]|nr:unnamed protein product [Rotaria sp. Silwood2]CAF3298830.1 unnamed protein product [Rotaria sp. Silwood2]CAF4519457.1 unnamed protein product [Rotaria sp. Silwood2]CAF4810291.1 unnamed protein product [Rotaria sp. Silwood2]